MRVKLLGAVIRTACALALLGGLVIGPAEAQQWRMASKMPAESSEGVVFQKFADLVKQYTVGKLTVQIYPAEQLGKEAAVLEQLQLGTIQLYVDSAFFMQKWVPDIKWIAPSFLFSDREHWVRFMDTPLVKGWFDQVEKQQGITTLGHLTDVVRGPYRVLVSKRPITSIEDLKGLKMRMYPDQLATAVWTHLGAETQQIAFTETYQAIKNGVVESVTSPIALVEDLKFYEVAPNIVRTDEFFQEIAFMMNAKAFKNLAPDLQQALLRAHKDAGAFSVQVMNDTATNSIKRMTAKGAKYTTLDTAPIIARMHDFYQAEDKAGHVPAGYFAAVEATRNK